MTMTCGHTRTTDDSGGLRHALRRLLRLFRPRGSSLDVLLEKGDERLLKDVGITVDPVYRHRENLRREKDKLRRWG